MQKLKTSQAEVSWERNKNPLKIPKTEKNRSQLVPRQPTKVLISKRSDIDIDIFKSQKSKTHAV